MNSLILVNISSGQKVTCTHIPRKTVGYILNGIVRALLTRLFPCNNAFLTGIRNFIFIDCHLCKNAFCPFSPPPLVTPKMQQLLWRRGKRFKTWTPYFLKLEIIKGQFSYNLSTLYPLPELVFIASNSLIFKVKHYDKLNLKTKNQSCSVLKKTYLL